MECQATRGGIVEVLISKADGVSAATDSDDSTVTGVTGGTWKRYEFRKNTGSMTSTFNPDDANGNNVSTELVLQFSRMDTAKRIEMNALSLQDLVCIVTDANGTHWYLGKDVPVSATAGNGQTGTARTDGNFYTLTLTDSSVTWPYTFTGTLPTVS